MLTRVAYMLRHFRPSVCCVTFASQRVSIIVIPGCLFVCLSVSTNGRPRQRTVLLLRSSSRLLRSSSIRSRRDSGSRQTLLVLQFLIEFASVRAQYSPSTYASTHVGFFWSVPYCPNGSPLKLEMGLATIRDASCPYGLSVCLSGGWIMKNGWLDLDTV